jgi:CBS-domain-containing membrane protein
MLNIPKSFISRRWSRIVARLPELWKNYLYQSFLATVVVFLVLLMLTVENVVVIASIGATAFIVFTMPKNITARPRRIIGGHFTGLFTGSLCYLIPHSSTLVTAIILSLAVGVSICLMVALDFEHPPASGTALGVALTGFSVDIFIAILTSVIILSIAHHFAKRYIRNLV